MDSTSACDSSIFFTKLPRELRDAVYAFLGSHLVEIHDGKALFYLRIHDAPYPDLLLVSKQFKEEYKDLRSIQKPRVVLDAGYMMLKSVPQTFLGLVRSMPQVLRLLGRTERIVVMLTVYTD
jgi:hypothetical protein